MSLLDFLRQPSTTDVRGFLRDIPVRKGGILPLTEYGDGSARLDWTAGVPGSIMEAFTAPARAYRGEIAPEQMIPEGLNFAGSVALGSAGVTRPKLGASVPRDEAIAQAIMREHPVQGKWDQTVGTSDYFMPQTLPNPGRVPQGNRPIPTVLDRENGWGDVYMQSGSTNPDHAARATASLEHFGVPGMKTPMNDLAAEPLTTYDLAALNQAWRNKVRHKGEFFSNPETSAAPGLGLMAAAKQAEQPHEPPLMSILRAKGILP